MFASEIVYVDEGALRVPQDADSLAPVHPLVLQDLLVFLLVQEHEPLLVLRDQVLPVRDVLHLKALQDTQVEVYADPLRDLDQVAPLIAVGLAVEGKREERVVLQDPVCLPLSSLGEPGALELLVP